MKGKGIPVLVLRCLLASATNGRVPTIIGARTATAICRVCLMPRMATRKWDGK